MTNKSKCLQIKKYCIYKVENLINHKIYIGFTSDFDMRKYHHYNKAFSERTKYLFSNALRKYGKENFYWEIVYQSDDLEDTLNNKEGKFIKEYNSHFQDGWGYNMTYGGDGRVGCTWTEEQKLERSIAYTGRKMPPGTGEKISKANKGRKFTKEHIAKMKAHKKTKEHIAKMADTKSTWWLIEKPDKKRTIIRGMEKFCKDNNLQKPNLHSTIKHPNRRHKGYRAFSLKKEEVVVCEIEIQI